MKQERNIHLFNDSLGPENDSATKKADIFQLYFKIQSKYY